MDHVGNLQVVCPGEALRPRNARGVSSLLVCRRDITSITCGTKTVLHMSVALLCPPVGGSGDGSGKVVGSVCVEKIRQVEALNVPHAWARQLHTTLSPIRDNCLPPQPPKLSASKYWLGWEAWLIVSQAPTGKTAALAKREWEKTMMHRTRSRVW